MGSIKCILCLDVIEGENKEINFIKYEKFINMCKTYLTIEIDSVLFLVNKTHSLMCTTCLSSVDQLYIIDKQFEEIKKKLSEYSTIFSGILRNRRLKIKEVIEGSNDRAQTVDFTATDIKQDLDGFELFIEEDSNPENYFGDNDNDVDLQTNSQLQVCDKSIEPLVGMKEITQSGNPSQQQTKSRDIIVKPKPVQKVNREVKANFSKRIPSDDDNSSDEDDSCVLFGCWKCSEKFQNKEEFDIHSRSHMKEEIDFNCESCGKVFLSRKSLKLHKTIHTPIKESGIQIIVKCEKCGKTFATENYLIRHQKISKCVGKIHKCNLCEKSYFWSQNLYLHKKNAHSGKIKQRIHRQDKLSTFFCEVCGKILTSYKSFNYHKRIHTGEKSLKCDENGCEETFMGDDRLRYHKMKVHTNGYPYACPHDGCGKNFKFKRALSKHSISHLPRTYVCETCGKGFKEERELERHKGTHNAACDLCNKTFKDRRQLNRHKKQLNCQEKQEPKNYICYFCGIQKPSNTKLADHIRTHTGEKPYQCKQCKKCFTSSSRLSGHRKERDH